MKIGRGNRSTRRKSAPPQIPLDQTRAQTRPAAKPATNRLSYVAANVDKSWKKTTKNLSGNTKCLDKNSNSAPPEHKSRALLLHKVRFN
jgi:hypothetical protein